MVIHAGPDSAAGTFILADKMSRGGNVANDNRIAGW